MRGGYGMFYGRTPSIMIGTAHSNNGINVQTLTFTGAQMPTYPNIFPTLPTGVNPPKPTIFVFDPNFENPMVHQASIGVEHARHARRRGRRLLPLRERPAPPALDGHQRRLARRTTTYTDASGNVVHDRHGTGTTGRSRTSPASSSSRARRSPSTTASRVEVNKRFSQQLAGAHRLHVQQGHRHEAGRDGRRPGRRRRRQVGLRPAQLRRGPRRGRRRRAAPPRRLGVLGDAVLQGRGRLAGGRPRRLVALGHLHGRRPASPTRRP